MPNDLTTIIMSLYVLNKLNEFEINQNSIVTVVLFPVPTPCNADRVSSFFTVNYLCRAICLWLGDPRGNVSRLCASRRASLSASLQSETSLREAASPPRPPPSQSPCRHRPARLQPVATSPTATLPTPSPRPTHPRHTPSQLHSLSTTQPHHNTASPLHSLITE